ncbi:DUF4389 domain-containing protein [Nocardia sp. BMG111209]|uniref:DUF4389 domain-containing protein n=1 Tax=Nocardia sp. BMG111209 TaxID=1160137 RepID=UPI00036E42EE|nr:DUF4389 domain-containing protein [Nocardia sp. BMG111209]
MSSGSPVYPIRVRGDLDPALSRWQWIIKWILAIPHIVVLIFLYIAYFVVTVIAFFAILFTGRYPRGLFDFNVGVLRWSWRVRFYAGALGTDRYPPFSLGARADYPADVEVDYPERLNRWLVLIKWWLLALPQYLIVAALTGGGMRWMGGGHHHHHHGGGVAMISLAAVLFLVAGFALLCTGRYPGGVFALLVGVYRWSIRVRGYASLFTDEYPPFRLDQGAREPAPEPAQPGPDTTEPTEQQ